MVTAAPSLSRIVPVPVSVEVTPLGALETVRPTVKVSSPSNTASAVVETVNVCVSPALPAKLSAVALAV